MHKNAEYAVDSVNYGASERGDLHTGSYEDIEVASMTQWQSLTCNVA